MAKTPYKVPFNRSCIIGSELEYIESAIQRNHLSGDGYFTRKCEDFFQKEFEAEKVLLTTSCTDALEMTSLLLDIKPGDEVIVPSFTFVSTVNAYVLRGARAVFVDIDPETLCMNIEQVKKKITKRTRVIVPVHYAGNYTDMAELLSVAKENNIKVVEDNAHGIFAEYRGRKLGTFGSMSTLSFHETKNISCGEGGALVVNDPVYAERAEIIREKGTNRKKFFRGEIRKYEWVDLGSSFLPSELCAAYLWGQLENKDLIQKKRKSIWNRYYRELAGWCESYNVQRPLEVLDDFTPSWHMFYLIFPDRERLVGFKRHMEDHGIQVATHYEPLHSSPYAGQSVDIDNSSLPVTERVSQTLVRMPFYYNISEEEQRFVIETTKKYTKKSLS